MGNMKKKPCKEVPRCVSYKPLIALHLFSIALEVTDDAKNDKKKPAAAARVLLHTED
jgi:hypothetical protein